jgi:multiple sugar transport system substrate-binding protein
LKEEWVYYPIYKMKELLWMRKRRISALLLTGTILGSMVAFTGCSDGGTSASSGSVPSEGDKTPITLNITWWGSQTRHDYTKKLLDMYHQKHPNISFTSTPAGYDGYEKKLTTQAAGNALPDIIQMDYSFMSEFTQNGSLADLASYVNDKTIDMSTAAQDLVNSGKIGDKFCSIVIAETAPSIVYNPSVLKKANVPEPTSNWNWGNLVNDCIAIQQKTGKFGFGTTLPSDSVDMLLNYYLRQNNQSLYSTDGKKLGYTDDKDFVNFVSQFKRMQDAKAEPTVDQYTQIFTKGKEQSLVAQNEAGFMFEWANYPTIVEATNPNLKLAVMPNDSKSVKAMYLKPSMFFSISNNSKYKKQCAEFINWFINDIDANKVINAERGVPVSSKVRSAMESSLSAQNKKMFQYIDEVSKNSSKVSAPDPSGSSEVRTDLNNEVDAVLYGKKTAAQAASDFRTEANTVLGRNQ